MPMWTQTQWIQNLGKVRAGCGMSHENAKYKELMIQTYYKDFVLHTRMIHCVRYIHQMTAGA